MADIQQLGFAGLQGWRKKVGDVVASPAASRTPFSEDQVRAAVGVLFFVLSVKYVVDTVRQTLSD
jgi:hypothetical protein